MVRLVPRARRTILAHAADAGSGECCGFLLGIRRGGTRTVREAHRAENRTAGDPRAGFLIPPRAYLEVQLAAERRGLEVVGFYHSHPGGEGRAAEADPARDPSGCFCVFVGTRPEEDETAGSARDALTSWVLAADRSRFEPEEIMSDASPENAPEGTARRAGDLRRRAGDPPPPVPGGPPRDPGALGSGSDDLSPEERVRYSRHMLIPEVGEAGQRRLRGSSVLQVGLGGLGSPVALYLAAAGVGRLGLVDFDRVDATNLQRQIIHRTADVGRSKLDSARERVEAVNPHVRVETHHLRLAAENAFEVLGPYDVIVDGTDNFATRYLVNDACALLGKPQVYGSIYRFEGQVSVFDARRGPCYRCLYPEPPPPGSVPGCAEGGVLGILPGIIGSIQAAEAVKLLLGAGDTLAGRLLLLDALAMQFRELRLEKDPACPVCGTNPSITALIDYDEFCGPGAETAESGAVPEITATELARRRDEVQVIDVREPFETRIASIPGARLIPLGELPARLGELDRGAELVMQCRSGVRSAAAVRLLLQEGFVRVRNLKGGILAWAEDVDPSLTRY